MAEVIRIGGTNPQEFLNNSLKKSEAPVWDPDQALYTFMKGLSLDYSPKGWPQRGQIENNSVPSRSIFVSRIGVRLSKILISIERGGNEEGEWEKDMRTDVWEMGIIGLFRDRAYPGLEECYFMTGRNVEVLCGQRPQFQDGESTRFPYNPIMHPQVAQNIASQMIFGMPTAEIIASKRPVNLVDRLTLPFLR